MKKLNKLLKTILVAATGSISLISSGCTSTDTSSMASANQSAQETSQAVESPKTLIALAQGPVVAALRNYLAAAGQLDASASKSFLSVNCTDDIVVEFQADAKSGWKYSEAYTTIESQAISPDGKSATVKAQVITAGGNSFSGSEKTFSLVLEGSDWKISGMNPKPIQVEPLSPL